MSSETPHTGVCDNNSNAQTLFPKTCQNKSRPLFFAPFLLWLSIIELTVDKSLTSVISKSGQSGAKLVCAGRL